MKSYTPLYLPGQLKQNEEIFILQSMNISKMGLNLTMLPIIALNAIVAFSTSVCIKIQGGEKIHS